MKNIICDLQSQLKSAQKSELNSGDDKVLLEKIQELETKLESNIAENERLKNQN